MTPRANHCVRAVALVGPSGAGKTTLAQALTAIASGAAPAPETRGPTTEISFSPFAFAGDRYTLYDTPGSMEFACQTQAALPAVDLALVVVDPDPDKALLAQPALKELERLRLPHALFVNKIDTARGAVRDLLAALQGVSAAPLVARQIPIWADGQVTGFVDLALERAYAYRPGKPSERIDIPETLAAREHEARFHMLEKLADFDDDLMETLLSDAQPRLDLIFSDLKKETADGRITPVFFGAALQGFGLRRLLKTLRHDAPTPERSRDRLGGVAGYVVRTSHAGQAGKLSYARIFADEVPDGAEVNLGADERARISGVFDPLGLKKQPRAIAGETVALGKLDAARAGMALTLNGPAPQTFAFLTAVPFVYSRAIAPRDRKDDVKLSAALAKLVDEDPGLSVEHSAETHEILLRGQGDTHLRLALEKLRKRFGVDVLAAGPATPYKETIRRSVTQRGRHKKQSGGHGQFGDVVIEVKALPRGAGFVFSEAISGGVVPRQWIPAVEAGVRDALEKGPLGYPVIDVSVTLIDGSHHAVDSSEIAFRQAGRIAMSEALQAAEPYLLEPIEKLVIFTPANATSKVTSALSGRHGQILGFAPRQQWPGWDVLECFLPHAERQDFIIELRSLTQGLGHFQASFDHRVEVTGRRADDAVRKAKSAA